MKTQLEHALHRRNDSTILVLCFIAGVLYNSWPLGYILDDQTAHHGLASDLEKVGHPHYWVFILGDILTGLCLMMVAALILFQARKRRFSTAKLVIATSLLLFGLFTGVAALLPSECTVTGMFRCGADHGEGLGLDAFTSSIAAAGMLIGLIYLCLKSSPKRQHFSILKVLTQATALSWMSSGILFASLALTNKNAHFSQDVFMIVTGLAIFVIGLNVVQPRNT